MATALCSLMLAALLAVGAPSSASAAPDVAVGTVVPWGGTAVPSGWLRADGAAVSRTTYAELFAAIGTTYGAGDGSTTFALPDLRQRFPLGRAAAGTGSVLGGTGGAIDHTHALGTHDHPISAVGTHTHDIAAHSHSLPGHRHTNIVFGSMTANGQHNHQLDGGRNFLVVNGSGSLYNLATGAIEIDQRTSTTTNGGHSHAYNGDIGNYASGNHGNAAFTSTLSALLTSSAAGAHSHGGLTGTTGAPTTAANPRYQTVDYLIKATNDAAAPCGAIWGSARATPAPGTLAADGAATSRATQANLFGCLGTTYGAGDGSTTFNLPDLRGRFGLGKATAGTGSVLGSSGGALDHSHDASHAHSVGTDGSHAHSMPSHTHNAPGHYHNSSLDTTTDGGHAHNSNQGGAMVGEQDGGNFRGSGGTRDYDTPISTTYDGSHGHSVTGSVGNQTGSNGNSAFAMTASAAVTSGAGGSHDHGGATLAATATTDAANRAFRAIIYELQTSATYRPDIGTITPFAGTGTAPAGWLDADGAAVSRTTYASLFAAIGTTYGAGDGSTTFNLPDLRGRFALGTAAAGTGSTLGGAGGSLDHAHSSNHAHGLTAAANHDHGGLSHDHDMPGHNHDFTRTFGSAGNHQHTFPGGGNFWGTSIASGSEPVTNVAQGGSRNAAHVNQTDDVWGSHRHTDITGTVGQAADPTGNSALPSGLTDPDAVDAGSHAHTIDPRTAATTSANPPFLALRYLIRVSNPTIVDNQAGDTTWRRVNDGSYDVDFGDATGVARFEVNTWSATGRTGVEHQAWTQVAAPGTTSYSTDWSLPASTWSAMVEGVNYVSVRMWTTGDAQSATLVDAFYVRKDTVAAAPTGVRDGPGVDIDYSASLTAIDANWTGSTGETGMSGVLRYEYCIATGAGCTGTVARSWTSVGTATSVAASSLTLTNGTTYSVATRMVDAAGNTSTAASSDAFTVDATGPPAPALVSPPAGSAHPAWPSLVATYADPAPATPGLLEFEVCTTSACTTVVESGASSSGLASGTNGSWTPTVATGSYWWRARAVDGAGTAGPWSAARDVQVGNSTLVVSAGDVGLGLASPGVPIVASTSVSVSSNAINGYQLQLSDTSNTVGIGGASSVPDWTGTVAAPTTWPSGTAGYFGVSVLNAPGGRAARWGATGGPYPTSDFTNNLYAGLTTSPQTVHARAGFDPSTEVVEVAFRFTPTATTTAGSYTASVTTTLIANP